MNPANEQELSEIIANARDPLRIQGGGTRPIGVTAAKAVLGTRGLTGVRLYEPGALTLVAGAGTPLAEVEALLAQHGQRLAFEPMDHRTLLGTGGVPTIGGMVAANVSGPRRVQVGACRDFLLGVRFVDGCGKVVKNGGRVMKNVTGYDLVKLMAGSFGTLGVLSEVSLKVLPTSEACAVLLVSGLGVPAAIGAMSQALASPFEVSGAAHVPGGFHGEPLTMIRVEGFAKSVAYRAEKLRDRLREFGEINIEAAPERTAADWQWVRDVAGFAGKDGDVWRVSLKPSDAPRAAERLAGEKAELLFDWGGGLIWVRLRPGTDLRSLLVGIPGHARLERAGGTTMPGTGVFAARSPMLDRISRGLRDKFDPRNILNPGLMG